VARRIFEVLVPIMLIFSIVRFIIVPTIVDFVREIRKAWRDG